MKTYAALLALIALLPACKVKEGRAPKKIPAGISVPITVDGGAGATLTSDWLQSRKPDFEDSERRAWRIDALVPEAGAPGAVLEIQSGTDAPADRLELKPGPSEVAVVTFNQNGELVAKVLDPKEAFPAFHGRGGNRGRGGAEERVRAVTAIRVRRGETAGGRRLEVRVDGKPAATWTDAELTKLEQIPFTGKDGEPTKGWSLRDLARTAGGDGARVAAVITGDGAVAIDEAAWKDAARTPLLRRNARGELKLDWASGGKRAEGPEAFGVTAVHVVPGA